MEVCLEILLWNMMSQHCHFTEELEPILESSPMFLRPVNRGTDKEHLRKGKKAGWAEKN